MGMSKSVVIGHRYYMGIHVGIGRGPVNELVEWQAAGKTAFSGSVTSSQQISIDVPDLFGGEKKEGGLQGTLNVMMGEPTQVAPAKLASMLGGDVPGFRGIFTVFFDGLIGAMNPYLKPWKFRVRRTTAGWDGGAWYPTKAKVELSAGAIHAMNPAHIIYECLTNREWGGGMARSRLNDAAFRAAADQLHAEGFGLCLRWNRQDSVSKFVQTVLDHIGATLYLSRFDGTFHLDLVRADYNPDDLPLFDEDSGLLGIDEDENAATAGAANELIIKWHDPIKNEARQWRERNLAGIQSDGQTLSTTMELIGLPTAELAGRVAVRELRQRSTGLKRFKVRLDRRGYAIQPGQPFRIRSLKRGINTLVVRAARFEDGTLADSTITVTAVQDVFGLPSTSISSGQPSGWVPPDPTPQAATSRRLVELTWRDLARTIDPANLALIDPTACYLAAQAVKPTALSLGYALQTRVGAAPWVVQDDGDFCPSGLLVAALGPTDTAFTLSAGTDLDFVEVGGAALLGDEIVRVDSFNPATLSGTLARGCVDTVPASHAAGARLWFIEDSGGADPTAYSPTVTVQARLLTQTSQGLLAEVLAPTDSLITAQRQGRPYPPAKLRISGSAAPASVTGDVVLTWAHRDRLLQADQLLDTEQGSVGPEAGTTYSARLLRADTLAVLVSQTGISGTTATLATTYVGQVTLEVWSVREGIQSLQRHAHTFQHLV
ncbi:putative phage tail protein [compost metagenome]